MTREAQKRLVRQAKEFPRGAGLSEWPPVVRHAVWLAHAHATGSFSLNLVAFRVVDFGLASPAEQKELVATYRDRARFEPEAWDVLTTLFARGDLDELPPPPHRGRGRPFRSPRKATGPVLAHALLRTCGLRSHQAEEVLATWLGYRGDCAVESLHRQITRCRPAAREHLKSLRIRLF